MAHRIAVLGIVAALLLSAASRSDDTAAMTEQDVVLLHVGGASEEEIIERIRTADVEFDLSDEMLDELRVAGIPARILAEMKQRQAEMTPAPPPGTAIGVQEGESTLTIRLNPERDGDEPATIEMLNALAPEAALALGIRTDDPLVTQLGLIVFCRTADHVPDHWRAQTVLGRDFNAPRHVVLSFLPGGTTQPAAKWRDRLSKMTKAQVWRESMADLEVLTYEVPDRVDVPLAAAVAHDLSLALTMVVDGQTRMVLRDDWDGITLDEGETRTVEAEFHSRKKDPLKAEVAFLGRPGKDE